MTKKPCYGLEFQPVNARQQKSRFELLAQKRLFSYYKISRNSPYFLARELNCIFQQSQQDFYDKNPLNLFLLYRNN
jgi:hypothetical protein